MNKGFTLLEIAIVMAIIGLLAGGIAVGTGLIGAAETQRIMRESQQFQSAVELFQERYDALPGDLPNANEYWAECTDVTANTCNGNGDGSIANLPTAKEEIRAWQHLSLV